MRFVKSAGLNLLLAMAQLAGVGCASMSPKLNTLPKVAQRGSESRLYHAARHAEQEGRLTEARDIYASLHHRSPNTVAFAHRLAVVSTQLGDYANAQRCFEQARRLDPNNPSLLTDMGYAAFVQKDYVQAEGLLREAVRLNPKDQRAVNNLAMSIGFQGRYEECLATFRKANDETQSLNNLAYVHADRGETEQAIQCYRRTLALDPSNSVATNAIARLESTSRTPASDAIIANKSSPSSDASVVSKESSSNTSVNQEAAEANRETAVATDESQDWYDLPDLSDSKLPPLNHSSASKVAEQKMHRQASEILEDDEQESSQFKKPLVKFYEGQVASRQVAHPLIEDDSPYFEDQDDIDRPRVATLPAIASSRAMRVEERDFERPKIVPFGSEEPVEEKLVTQTGARREKQEVVHQAWDEEETIESIGAVEPKQLPSSEDAPATALESDEEELASLFGSEDNIPDTSMADSEELDDLAWVKEEEALLATTDPDVTEDPVVRSTEGLKGFCPVAIRDERRLAEASDAFTFEFQSQTYRFSSAEARDKFEANPERYAPVAGGLDIVAVRSGDVVASGSLDYAVWYRHRLHLFSTPENLAMFRSAPKSFGSVH